MREKEGREDGSKDDRAAIVGMVGREGKDKVAGTTLCSNCSSAGALSMATSITMTVKVVAAPTAAAAAMVPIVDVR